MSFSPLAARLAGAAALAPFLAPGALGQESLAVFDAPVFQEEIDAYSPPPLRLYDYDGDGDLDSIGVWPSIGETQFQYGIYENDGRGTYGRVTTPKVTHANTGNTTLEVGDLNGDGYGDALILAGSSLFPIESTGLGHIRTEIPLPEHAWAIAFDDLNGDGNDDFVAVSHNKLFTYYTGSNPTSTTLDHARGERPLYARVAETNGDGILDLLVAVDGAVDFYEGQGDGTFLAGATMTHGFAAGMFDVGDVDGDGDVDAVVFDDVGMTSYCVLRRTGPPFWTMEPEAVGGPAEFLRDVDGDGDLDGVCCSSGGGASYAPNSTPSTFMISLNDGGGNFAPSFTLPGYGSPQLAGVGDIDGDLDLDLVAGRVVVYARGSIEPPAPSTRQSLPLFHERDVHDFDGDGDPDLGLSLQSVWVNDGTGVFTETATDIPAAPARTVFRGPGYPGDFDGDGDVDLLVEHRYRRRPAQVAGFGMNRNADEREAVIGMRLLRNDGNGVFEDGGSASAPGVTFTLGSLAAEASLAADLNLDGTIDLVTRTMSFPAKSRFWHNPGSGVFKGPYELDGIRAERVEDLNHDGIPDLFVSLPNSYWVGTQMLEIASGFAFPGGTTGWVLENLMVDWGCLPLQDPIGYGDLTADGYTDVAFNARGYSNSFGSPLQHVDQQGNGGVGFTVGYNLDFGFDVGVGGIRVGDLDGDGADDALAGPMRDLSLACDVTIKNTATTFGFERVRQLMPNGLLVDVDGDGDLDVVAERVVLNASTP